MSVNKVILLGYVGNDPDVRFPEKDMCLAKVSLATNEYMGRDRQEITEWHRLVFTGSNAQVVERYVRKGSRIYVEGRLHTSEYVDRLQISRKITEIFVDRLELLGRSENSTQQ